MHHLSLSDPDKEDRCIEMFQKKVKGTDRLEFVFDNQGYGHGFPIRESFGTVQKITTSDGETADQYMIQEIKSVTQPQSLVVVSSDHEIQNAAKAHHIAFMSSGEFLTSYLKSTVSYDEKPEFQGMSQKEKDAWLAIFESEE